MQAGKGLQRFSTSMVNDFTLNCRQIFNHSVKETFIVLDIGLTRWPGLLEAWLVLTSVKYHGNLYILIPLNQRLALTRLQATGPWSLVV